MSDNDIDGLLSEVSKMSTDEIITATAKLRAENAMREDALNAMKDYTKSVSLYSVPPNPYANWVNAGMYSGSVFMTSSNFSQLTFDDPVKIQEQQNIDRKRQLKLFIHFARLFCEKYPKWQVLPEADDPFNKVKLVRPDIGASITSLYPMHELAVYGGPDLWMGPLKELGQTLPIVKIKPQEFFMWALGEDTPEWVR